MHDTREQPHLLTTAFSALSWFGLPWLRARGIYAVSLSPSHLFCTTGLQPDARLHDACL